MAGSCARAGAVLERIEARRVPTRVGDDPRRLRIRFSASHLIHRQVCTLRHAFEAGRRRRGKACWPHRAQLLHFLRRRCGDVFSRPMCLAGAGHPWSECPATHCSALLVYNVFAARYTLSQFCSAPIHWIRQNTGFPCFRGCKDERPMAATPPDDSHIF